MNLIKKEFVPYHIAIKLKKINFHEICIGMYSNNKNLTLFELLQGRKEFKLTNKGLNKSDGYCTAPLWSQVQSWLRNKHKLLLEVNCVCVGDLNLIQYKYTIIHHWKVGNHLKELNKDYWFDSYEKALVKGIKESLKIIKK